MKWYLAGPMSGIAQFNIPAFDEATETLRFLGYDITSPAELDSVEVRAAAMKSKDGAHSDVDSIETWGDMLARDVKIISDNMDAVVFLPGWHDSQGARLEAYVALLTKKKFAVYVNQELRPIDKQAVKCWLIHGINGL